MTTQAAPLTGEDVKRRSALGGAVRDLAELFSDFWFGMSLLAVWGLMTLIGVVVDQGKEASFYSNNYIPALARLVLRLHLDNIYHSPAYIAIVALIVSTMIFATFRVVIPRRLPPLRGVKIDYIPLNASVDVSADPQRVRDSVTAFFSSRGWSIRKRDIDGTEWTFADKHNWARKGVLIAHVGFILIAAGTTIYWAFGFDGTTAVLSGETVSVPKSGAQLRLDRFAYRIDPIKTRSGIVYQPIDYVSTLHVAGKDEIFRPTVLRVNHPIDIDGTLYYQASYGYAIALNITKDGHPIGDPGISPSNNPISASEAGSRGAAAWGANGGRAAPFLKEGATMPIDATHGLRYSRFVGTIDRATSGIGSDPRPNDPGVVLQFFEGDRLAGTTIVPIGDSVDLGSGYRVEPRRYVLYSGIQYRHDPGIPLVGLGAAVLLAGLIISFYFVPARLYVRVDAHGARTTIGVAATTVKGYDIFEEQFRELVGALRRAVPAPA